MATVQADTQPNGKRKKKERFIKRGYHHGSERDGDARRRAAKRFLTQITLDGETVPQLPMASPQAQTAASQVTVGSTSRGHVRSLSNGTSKVLPPVVSAADLAATSANSDEVEPPSEARPDQGAPEGPITSPIPGPVCRLSSADSPVTWGRPSHHDPFQRPATELG